MEAFTAVMSNFQTAINATEDGLYSMGSASRENEKYMDSIEGKLSGLSSAWQKFSTDLISSDFVKGAVSGLTGFLNVLDQIPIKTIAVGAGISALVLNFANIAKGISTFVATVKGAILPLQAFISTVALMKDSKGLFGAITLATETTATSLAPLIASLTTLAPVLAGLAAFAGLSAIIDATTVSLEEQEQAVTDVTGKLENLKGEYDALASSPSLSASDQARLKSLEAQITANEQILKQEKEKLAYQKFGEGSRPQTKGFLTEGGTVDQPSGAEKLKSQAKQLQSDIKAYKDLDKQIANTDKNSKDYAKTVQDLSDKQDKLKSSIDEQAASMIPVADEFRELYDAGVITGDEYVELMGILDDVVGAYNELGQSSAEAMSGDTATPWVETTERIKEATNAINEYHKALQENPERNQEFKSYADAWHTLNQEIQNGTTSSVAFRESAKFLFGEDWVNSVRYSADAIGERAKQTGVLFETAESNGMGLITALKNLADESGNVKNAMGETIATISDADGQLTFDIPKQNLAELAEMLGTTEDGLTSLMHGLEMYGGTAMFGDISDYVNQAKDYGTALDGVGDSAGKSLVNLKQFEQEMINAKVPADQAMDIIDRLASSNTVIDIGVDPSSTNAVEQAEAKLDELGVTIDTMNGKELSIDVQSLVELGQTMGLTDIQIVQLAENFGLAQEAANQLGTVSFDATTSSLEKIMPSANKVQKALDKLGKTKSTAKIEVKDNASKKISDVLSKVRNLAKQKASVSITAKDNASSVISTIQNKLNSLKDKVINVTTRKRTVGSDDNTITGQFATGTKNFEGGRALVGDEYSPNGKPKPELVIANGQAFLAGQKGPEVLNLPRGAQILSNTETEKALGSESLKGVFPAFDGGTISLQQYQTATGTSSSTSSSGSSASQGSSGSGTSATNKETSAQKNLAKATNDANEALENQKKIYDEEIDILDHQLFLMGKNKDAYADQVAQVQTILKKLEEQANWYRSQGEKEESKYIRELQKQWKQNTTFIQRCVKQTYLIDWNPLKTIKPQHNFEI